MTVLKKIQEKKYLYLDRSSKYLDTKTINIGISESKTLKTINAKNAKDIGVRWLISIQYIAKLVGNAFAEFLICIMFSYKVIRDQILGRIGRGNFKLQSQDT